MAKSVLFYCITLTSTVLPGDGVGCRQNGCGVGYAQLGSLCNKVPMLGIFITSVTVYEMVVVSASMRDCS